MSTFKETINFQLHRLFNTKKYRAFIKELRSGRWGTKW